MAIPDVLEIDLGSLRAAENCDMREHIAALLRKILFSEEVTKGPDEEGDWPQDSDWEPVFDAPIRMRKVERKPLAALAGRGISVAV